MLTPFGKALRQGRLDRGLLLKDMADALHVSPSFLSAVEFGRKSIPGDLIAKLERAYSLGTVTTDNLKRAANASAREVTIKFAKGSGEADREAAALLARTFETGVSEEFLANLKELIERNKS